MINAFDSSITVTGCVTNNTKPTQNFVDNQNRKLLNDKS